MQGRKNHQTTIRPFFMKTGFNISCEYDFFFFFFFKKIGYDISYKLSLQQTICMQYQILFYWKNEKKNTNLMSVDFAHRALKVKQNA